MAGASLAAFPSAFPFRDGRPDASLAQATAEFPGVDRSVHRDLVDAGLGPPPTEFGNAHLGNQLLFSPLIGQPVVVQNSRQTLRERLL